MSGSPFWVDVGTGLFFGSSRNSGNSDLQVRSVAPDGFSSPVKCDEERSLPAEKGRGLSERRLACASSAAPAGRRAPQWTPHSGAHVPGARGSPEGRRVAPLWCPSGMRTISPFMQHSPDGRSENCFLEPVRFHSARLPGTGGPHAVPVALQIGMNFFRLAPVPHRGRGRRPLPVQSRYSLLRTSRYSRCSSAR